MAPPPPKYEVIYMLPGGEIVTRWKEKSPQPQSLYFYRPKRARYVCRWYPMFKVWRVYDLRLFDTYQKGRYQAVRIPGYINFDDKDAAVMWMGLNSNA